MPIAASRSKQTMVTHVTQTSPSVRFGRESASEFVRKLPRSLWNEHASPKPRVRSQRGVIIVVYTVPTRRLHPLNRFSNT